MHKLRKANKDDYDFAFDLFKTVYSDYVTRIWGGRDEELEKYYCENWFDIDKVQIILGNEKKIGVVEVVEKNNQLYIEEIQIEPESQRKGIATKVIKNIKEEAFKRNYSVGLSVLKINKAKELYERLGFKVIGETKSHFIMESVKIN